MDNSFESAVTCKGTDHMFPALLHTYGYSYKIEVNVLDQAVMFEPDEEQNYRAVGKVEDSSPIRKIDDALLKAIAETLQATFQ